MVANVDCFRCNDAPQLHCLCTIHIVFTICFWAIKPAQNDKTKKKKLNWTWLVLLLAMCSVAGLCRFVFCYSFVVVLFCCSFGKYTFGIMVWRIDVFVYIMCVCNSANIYIDMHRVYLYMYISMSVERCISAFMRYLKSNSHYTVALALIFDGEQSREEEDEEKRKKDIQQILCAGRYRNIE